MRWEWAHCKYFPLTSQDSEYLTPEQTQSITCTCRKGCSKAFRCQKVGLNCSAFAMGSPARTLAWECKWIETLQRSRTLHTDHIESPKILELWVQRLLNLQTISTFFDNYHYIQYSWIFCCIINLTVTGFTTWKL